MRKFANVKEYYLSGSLIEPGKSVITETEYSAMTPEGKALYSEHKAEKIKETKNDVKDISA